MQAYIYRQRETYIKMYEYIHKCMKKIIIAITITNFKISRCLHRSLLMPFIHRSNGIIQPVLPNKYLQKKIHMI
jgi:hypothetical protein